MASFRSIGRAFAATWRVLDASRRVLINLLFIAVVVALVVVFARSGAPRLADKTALVLELKGPLVEQGAAGLREGLERQALGEPAQGTQLRDVLAVLDTAAADPKIERVVLLLDEFDGAGLPALREVAAALERFKAGGKQVVAWGASYNQAQYYVAAHASEVWLHPMGLVYVKGVGRWRNYYRDALDRVGINPNVLRVGSYKSFGETFAANGPSKEALENETALYRAIWQTYTDGVERARKLPAGSITRGIDALPQRFAAVGGDTAKLALDAKLVDALKTRDQLRSLMIERGAKSDDGKTFRQVSFDDYRQRVKRKTGDAIGVVVAMGEIVDGRAPAGKVGGVSTAELIRKARDDDRIKAVVLRVDSPGGSAFASELVRRELEVTRAAGKPVIVSMGNLAASGGYWISMAADEVIADPATITGSIGVVAMLPTAERAMDKLSLHTGGVATTWLAGAYDPRRGLDPRFAQIVQLGIEHAYREFIGKAALSRKTTPQQIDAIAQGRVWTGAQAKERGLVDRLGSYGDALRAAAARAKLGDDPRIEYVEPERGPIERVLGMFDEARARTLAALIGGAAAGVPPSVAREVAHDLGWLADVAERRTPFGHVAHCLCAASLD
jgi:protease-4